MKKALDIVLVIVLVSVIVKFFYDKRQIPSEITPEISRETQVSNPIPYMDTDAESENSEVGIHVKLMRHFSLIEALESDEVLEYIERFFQACRSGDNLFDECVVMSRGVVESLCRSGELALHEYDFWGNYFKLFSTFQREQSLPHELSLCKSENPSFDLFRFLRLASYSLEHKLESIADVIRERIQTIDLNSFQLLEEHYVEYDNILSLQRTMPEKRDVTREIAWGKTAQTAFLKANGDLRDPMALPFFDLWLKSYTDVMRLTARLGEVVQLLNVSTISASYGNSDVALTWLQAACDYWIVTGGISNCEKAIGQISTFVGDDKDKQLRLDIYKMRLSWVQTKFEDTVNIHRELLAKYSGSITPIDTLLINLTMADVYKSLKQYDKMRDLVSANKNILGPDGNWLLLTFGDFILQSALIVQGRYQEAHFLGESLLKRVEANVNGTINLRTSITYNQAIASMSLAQDGEAAIQTTKLHQYVQETPMLNYYAVFLKMFVDHRNGIDLGSEMINLEKMLGTNHVFIHDFKNTLR